MSQIEVIHTTDAPGAVGPYSQAIVYGGLLYTAGQVAFDPHTGQLIPGSVSEQTDRVLQNLGAILRAAGSGFDKVLKTTVFLRDMDDFATMNEVYGRYFTAHRPARSTVQVARLPRDAAVEIEAIAVVG